MALRQLIGRFSLTGPSANGEGCEAPSAGERGTAQLGRANDQPVFATIPTPAPATVDISRRTLLHVAAGACAVTSFPRIVLGAEPAGEKLALTQFVLQDLEFRLATWIPPGDDGDAINEWVGATEANLNRLLLVCHECGLDQQVHEAVRKVLRIADIYRLLLRDLDFLSYVDSIVATQNGGNAYTGQINQAKRGYSAGLDFGRCARRFVTNMTIHTTAAVATSGASLAFLVADSVDAAERSARIKSRQKQQYEKIIRGAKEQLSQELRYLIDITGSLQSRFTDLRAPKFEALTGKGGYSLDPARTPYSHIAEAYKALNVDGVTAGRKLALAGDRVPPAVKGVPVAATYVASFALLAGHVLEFESRARSNARLAEESLVYFDRANSLLSLQSGSASSLAYPFLIATARALVATGQSDRAVAVLQRIQNSSDSGAVSAASVAYDMASLLAQTGRPQAALEQLRSSYKLFPRRDPQAMQDPSLRTLVAREPEVVRNIVDCPLVGNWKGPAGEYIFYVDGTFWQGRRGLAYTGRWEIQDSRFLLLADRKDLPAARPIFEINGDVLILRTDTTFTFTRAGSPGLLNGVGGTVSNSGRTLSPDGQWAWADGRKVLNARFTTSRSTTDSKRLFLYSHDDPLVGRVHQVLSQE